MSTTALKQDQRTPEREALAQAIADRSAAEAEARKVSDAKETSDETRLRAHVRVGAAERAVAEARRNEGRRLAAAALGERTDITSVGDAQMALEQATNDYAIAKNTSSALAQRLDEAVDRARRAEDHLKEAVRAVLKSEAQHLVAEQAAVCKRLAELTHVFTFLNEAQCGVVQRWGFDPDAADASCTAPWRVALDALLTDPDAQLPTE